MVEALAIGQGFNRRYDMFGLGWAQGAWDIEERENGWMVVAVSSDVDSLGPDSFLTHYSALLTAIGLDGSKQFEARTYRPGHGTTTGWANCADRLADGYVIAGATESVDGELEVYLMRFNAQGDTLWTRVFGDPQLDHYWIGQQVKRSSNGDFLVVGLTDQNGPFNAFVLRTDSNGNELWRQIQVYEPGIEGGLGAVSFSSDGDLFTSGTIALTPSNSNHWVQRLTSDGAVEWQVGWGGNWREGSTHVETLSDGHLLISGGTGYAADLTAQRPYLAKLDSADGSIMWEREYGPITYSTQFFPAKERPNGDLIAAGVCYYGGDQQGLLLRTTSEGDSIWMRSYYSQDTLLDDGNGRFYDVLPTEDGGFIAAGAAYFSASGNNPPGISQDAWVVKVDSMGCVVPGCDGVGVTEIITNLNRALIVYPNPAHGQVQVGITLPSSLRNGQALQLTFVSASGQVGLVHAAREGSNEVDIRALASGLYYIHLSNQKTWIGGSKLIVE
jgi:hypothetical protein